VDFTTDVSGGSIPALLFRHVNIRAPQATGSAAPSEAPRSLFPGSCTWLDGRPTQGMSYRREIYGSCNLGELLDVKRSCHTLK